MLLGQLGTVIVGFVGLAVITRLADREVFGEAALFTGLIVLGRNIFIAPIFGSQIRFHPDFSAQFELRAFTRLINDFTWRATGIFALVGLLAYVGWRGFSGGEFRPLLLIALAAYLLAEALRTVRFNFLSSERRQWRVSVWQVSEMTLQLTFGAIGLLLAQRLDMPITEFYLFGQACGGITATVVSGYWFFPRLDQKQNRPLTIDRRQLLRTSMRYGLPFVPLAVVGWAMSLGDRYALGYIANAESVGTYVAAYSIASRAVMFPHSVLNGFARNILFQATGHGQHDRAHNIFLLYLIATIVTGAAVSLALWLGGEWIADAVLDSRYREGAPSLFLWIGIAHALFGVTQTIENRVLSLGASRALILPALAGAFANVIACFWLIPSLGAGGAAMSKVVSGTVGCSLVVLVLFARRNSEMKVASAARSDR